MKPANKPKQPTAVQEFLKMQNENLQFYPTPAPTMRKMWAKFTNPYNTDKAVILEPHGGRGDLLKPFTEQESRRSNGKAAVDVIEIDFNNQAILREIGFNVICSDFLTFESKKVYSHICMNPPFARGAEHVLKAWEVLVHGELVALVNAETLKNPCDKYRLLLANIIEDNGGTVEFLADEFTCSETQRKTSVEVAIIHLKKTHDFNYSFISNLKADFTKKYFNGEAAPSRQELAIPNNVIENAVIAFNAAAKALHEEITILNQLRSNTAYCFGMLNQSISMTDTEAMHYEHAYQPLNTAAMLAEYHNRYDILKEKAWSTILRRTQVGKNLSRKVNEQLLADFEKVSKLEFTESNIYGFLAGLASEFGRMNQDMFIECFDLVTRYHPGNRCYFKGWKSNTKHKTNAFRIGMTRFVLPLKSGFHIGSLDYSDARIVKDFDLAFATLDGKLPDHVFGVGDVFNNDDFRTAINNSERIKTTYFDIRVYRQSGTVHFYPTNQKLIDRLNLIVGKSRNWIPQRDDEAPAAFWEQYSRAEDITKGLNKDAKFKELTSRAWKEEENLSAVLNMIEKKGEDLGLDMDFDAIEFAQAG